MDSPSQPDEAAPPRAPHGLEPGSQSYRDRFVHPKLTPERVIEAINLKGGILSEAARSLGVSRTTIYRYIEEHEEVAAAVKEEREVTLDAAEAVLKHLALTEKKERSLIFLLESLGKDRGYVKRTEQVGKDGGPMQHQHGLAPELTDEELRNLSPEELDALIAAQKVLENARNRKQPVAPAADGSGTPLAA